MSTDPKEAYFPGHSPYHFAGNSPVLMKDRGGNENMIYIYVNSIYENKGLTKEDHAKIQDKTYEVLKKVYQNNPQLEALFDIQLVTEPMEEKYLDENSKGENLDVSSAIGFASYLNSLSPKGFDFPQQQKKEKDPWGRTWNLKDVPAGVVPPKEHFADGNREISPNLIDQIAWTLVHEAFHRLADNRNTTKGHTERGLMKDKDNMNSMPDKEVSKWSDQRFELNEDWVKFLNEHYGRRFENGEFFGIPEDNATERKADDNSNSDNEVDPDTYRLSPRF
jgi:hypothetical protein